MHKAKRILDAVTATLTGLPSTGSSVQQSRAYALENLPALTVRLGAMETAQELSSVTDSTVTIAIDIIVRGTADLLDDALLQSHAEIHAALLADPSLGLDFVVDVNPGGLSEPEMEQGSHKPTALCTATYQYRFRHLAGSLE